MEEIFKISLTTLMKTAVSRFGPDAVFSNDYFQSITLTCRGSQKLPSTPFYSKTIKLINPPEASLCL